MTSFWEVMLRLFVAGMFVLVAISGVAGILYLLMRLIIKLCS
jgi:hypothetical protein